MCTVWHVDKYKITFKLVINSRRISHGPGIHKHTGLSNPQCLLPLDWYWAANPGSPFISILFEGYYDPLLMFFLIFYCVVRFRSVAAGRAARITQSL